MEAQPMKTVNREARSDDHETRSAIDGLQVGIISCTGHRDQLISTGGAFLRRESVLRSLVEMQLYLARKLGHHELNPNILRDGVESMLENQMLGQIVLAWANGQILGQLEIKKPFEAWYNATYWYVDNYVVRPEFQRRGVGTTLLNFVRDMAVAHNRTIDRLRLYVAHDNADARRFYVNRGFASKGELLEMTLLQSADATPGMQSRTTAID